MWNGEYKEYDKYGELTHEDIYNEGKSLRYTFQIVNERYF